MVASRYDDEFIILLCALFAYGNAKLIVKFFGIFVFSNAGTTSTPLPTITIRKLSSKIPSLIIKSR